MRFIVPATLAIFWPVLSFAQVTDVPSGIPSGVSSGLIDTTVTSQAIEAQAIEPRAIEPQAVAVTHQGRCIKQMADFPTDDPTARYQFFKLVSDVAYGATDETRALFDHYGQPAIQPDTPILSTIEDVANPVLRQAAPKLIVSNMNYLIDFVQVCDFYIKGQMDSLIAFDPKLKNVEFNSIITEDALFLRQILSESLYKLGAEEDSKWSKVTSDYSGSLLEQRHAKEFIGFESEISEIESLFMEDLDGRLERSNKAINVEVDREILRDSVSLSNELTQAAEERAKQERLRTLIRIFGGGG